MTSLCGVVIKISLVHGNSNNKNNNKNGCTGFFCMDETFFNHLGPFFFKARPTDRVEIVSQTSDESDIITEKSTSRVLPKAVNNEITWAPRSSNDPPIYDESEEDVNNDIINEMVGETKEHLYEYDDGTLGSNLKSEDYDKWRPYYPGDNDDDGIFKNHHDVNATVDELTAPISAVASDADNINNNSEIRDLFEYIEILPDNPLPFLDNILPDYNYEVDLSPQYEDDVSRKSDDFTENTFDSTNETNLSCPVRCRCVCNNNDDFL